MFRRSVSGGGLALMLVALFAFATPSQAAPGDHPKLDGVLNRRANSAGTSQVIVVLNSGWDRTDVERFGGKPGRRLGLIGAQVLEVPNGMLKQLADHRAVRSVHYDRPLTGAMDRVAVSSGARSVQDSPGFTGAGVGVAVVDSGVTSWHDDLQYGGISPAVQTTGGQRIAAFVDFVNGLPSPYDDNGHGTHVSGIIAGNGYDSGGSRAGIAPDAHIVSLKVLDANGRGVISSVIAALDFVVANRHAYNIRVVNLSIGAAVTESYNTDPLTIAAQRAVDAGIVVVTAAGNLGRNKSGETQYGGITAPGNAPWVLTVGASSSQGTLTRTDDIIAPYSSRGPTAIDFAAKPDLVAFGTGIVSLSTPGSLLYSTKSDYLVTGTVDPGYRPYLSLSGTSMAAPVVAGAVALMIQANPALSPNLVKAVLQYTAQRYPSYDALTQGGGSLNVRGAVDLAQYFATARPGDSYPHASIWSRKIIWGTHRVSGGAISPAANAFAIGTTWGADRAVDGENIVWGTRCNEDCFNIVWGTFSDGFNIVWGTTDKTGFNIVWGTVEDRYNIVWGTGTGSYNIVWGTDCGGEDCHNIVWGTRNEAYNIVWGTCEEGYNIVWGTGGEGRDNIVWGTNADVDEFVWGPDADAAASYEFDVPPAEFDPGEVQELVVTVAEARSASTTTESSARGKC